MFLPAHEWLVEVVEDPLAQLHNPQQLTVLQHGQSVKKIVATQQEVACVSSLLVEAAQLHYVNDVQVVAAHKEILSRPTLGVTE